jgi:hypothetical protein
MLTQQIVFDVQEQIACEIRVQGFTDGYFNLEPTIPHDPEYVASYHNGQSHQDELDSRLMSLEF